MTRRQQEEASALCDAMLATIARIQDDFKKMKEAADQWRAENADILNPGAAQ